MKQIITPLLILFSITLSAQIGTYTFKRKLNKPEKEGYYALPLLPEVTAHCKSNLYDIRLYNIREKDTAEVPYLMEWMGAKNELTPVPLELINDTYNEKCCSYVTLKFTKKHPINQIILNIPDSNFDKIVKIEGSNDNKEWFTIREHQRIVGFNNPQDEFEYTTLNFPGSEYTYFRLKFDDDASRKVTVTEANAYENKATPGSYDELNIGTWKQTENKKEKTSEIILDMPYQYMVNHITIKSNSKTDFYRNINVYGTNGIYHTKSGDKESWYTINTSVLSSTEECSVACNNEAAKKLKIEIINYDNEPISISGIKAYGEQCRLVANLPASDNVYLTYGKTNDHEANYDMEHFKEKIPKTLNEIKYGPEEVKIAEATVDNNLVKNKNWLWIVIGAVILIIGYFALSMLKKEQE